MKLEIKGEINEQMLENISQEIYANYKAGEDVEIEFDSPGGYIETAEAIVDVITALKDAGSKIICKNTGDVMSSAVAIWLTGDLRVWDTRHSMLIHNPYVVNVSGDGEELLDTSLQLLEIENELAQVYSLFSDNDTEYILEIMKENRALSLRELEDLGFITSKIKEIRKYAKLK